MSNKAEEAVTAIAKHVREYVRDRFTPGSLTSLDELEQFVQVKITAASHVLNGYACKRCTKVVMVDGVICSECSLANKETPA